MKQKINKKSNTVMAVVCLLIGLALLAAGIYLLVTGGDRVTGGVIVGLGALIVALFGCTKYLIFNIAKLQQKAEDKAALEAERRRAERRREADRMRAERIAAPSAAAGKAGPAQSAHSGSDGERSGANRC